MIDLDTAIEELAWLDPEPVYVGGATVPLFLDDFGRSQMRPTYDVDCIVPQILTRKAWWELEAKLRRRGWSPDPDGPLCRYRSPSGLIVDLMSEDPAVLGFSGTWYPAVVSNAVRHTLPSGRTLLIATPALLLACKLEAFVHRGSADPWGSKDLEDIAALFDGCQDLLNSATSAAVDVQHFIASEVESIFGSPTLREALMAQLPRGGSADAQAKRIEALGAKLSKLQ